MDILHLKMTMSFFPEKITFFTDMECGHKYNVVSCIVKCFFLNLRFHYFAKLVNQKIHSLCKKLKKLYIIRDNKLFINNFVSFNIYVLYDLKQGGSTNLLGWIIRVRLMFLNAHCASLRLDYCVSFQSSLPCWDTNSSFVSMFLGIYLKTILNIICFELFTYFFGC